MRDLKRELEVDPHLCINLKNKLIFWKNSNQLDNVMGDQYVELIVVYNLCYVLD